MLSDRDRQHRANAVIASSQRRRRRQPFEQMLRRLPVALLLQIDDDVGEIERETQRISFAVAGIEKLRESIDRVGPRLDSCAPAIARRTGEREIAFLIGQARGHSKHGAIGRAAEVVEKRLVTRCLAASAAGLDSAPASTTA